MEIVNDTPHNLCFFDPKDTEGFGHKRVAKPGAKPFLVVPPSGIVPRVEEAIEQLPGVEMNGVLIPARSVESGRIYDLPAAKAGEIHVVAARCASAIQASGLRGYALVHDTVRDEKGQVVGCLALSILY